jgi:hypothetical protein
VRLSLIPHPDTPCRFADRLEVEVLRERGVMRLAFRLHGDMAKLRTPQPADQARRDGLWRTTCFEAFVRPGDGPAYFEFNLAPSNEWAAYAFDSYRQGMKSLEPLSDPEIGVLQDEANHELRAKLDLEAATGPAAGLPWRVGLSAVIESLSGEKSYWALAHPDGSPDFHHRDCFAVQLPAARTP